MNEDDLDYQAKIIKQQQDPRHDQAPFKIDVVCPVSGDEYVTTTPTYSYTFSGGTSDTVTIGTEDYSFAGDNLTYTIDGLDDCIPSKEFVSHLPTLDKIKKMCEQYPGLKKAYEHFVFAYKLTRQDYEGKVKAGELDD